MDNLKYEYHILIWGGFFNKEYKDIHKIESGDYYFDSEKKRYNFLLKLKKISIKLNAKMLMHSFTEGYNCRTDTILHRIIRYDGREYYSWYNMGKNYPYDAAMYHLEWKWNPGFNDYPLGDDFDYEKHMFKTEIIQEWITGAFSFKRE